MLIELMIIGAVSFFIAKQQTPATQSADSGTSHHEVHSAHSALPPQEKQSTYLTPFLGDLRNQQLEEFSTNTDKIGLVAKSANRNLMISLFSIGCVVAGRDRKSVV